MGKNTKNHSHQLSSPNIIPVGMVLVTHERLGYAFIESVTHILGYSPPALEAVCSVQNPEHEQLHSRISKACEQTNQGRGVLLLVDVFGSTPANFCCELIDEENIAAIAGVNLPLLLRALSYREEMSLPELMTELERKPYQLIQKLSRITTHEQSQYSHTNGIN